MADEKVYPIGWKSVLLSSSHSETGHTNSRIRLAAGNNKAGMHFIHVRRAVRYTRV
jgi:hypothetical protein